MSRRTKPANRTSRCWFAICVAFAAAAPAVVGAQDDAGANALSRLVEEATTSNPSLEVMRERTRELDELARVSSAWDDPRFSFEYSNAPVDSFDISDHPMGGLRFRLQQRLPEWGWTRAAREVAALDVEQSRHARAEAQLQLGRGVETLYWRLALSRLLRGVTERHLERTLELTRVVQARYEVGATGQNALLRLYVLRDRLEDDLADFERVDVELSAGLARALAREPGSRFDTPGDVEAVSPVGDASEWISSALTRRPALAALRDEIQRKEKAARLSRVRARPEVDVWVEYRLRTIDTPNDAGVDMFSAGFTVPIPWGSRKRALGGAAAELAARDGANARLASTRDEIEAELTRVEASWRRSTEKSRTYREALIPSATAALETTLADFAVGKAEFSTLYEAQVDLLELERAYLTATIDTHLQRAAARALIGPPEAGAPS